MVHDRLRARHSDARRQQVGPVFRAKQVAHVAVMRIEQHAGACPDQIGSARQEAAAGAAIALQRGDRDLAVAAQDRLGEIVDGVDVGPGFIRRRFGRFDTGEVDAVRPVVAPTHQHQHTDRLLPCPGVRCLQALALTSAHGAVVEVEVQETHAPGLFIANVLPGPAGRSEMAVERCFGNRRQCGRKDLRCRQLERVAGFLAAQVTDPYRAIDRCAQDRRLAPGDHFARRAGA
ncbi:MAG: hypothetical protein CAPSK01_004451 [Candidatus Accumulibacter vicinus]|uniref:Uncharacterized protein n=1 Tax=Candidatus Accumulibacter vicinus TaxID=2954382 RepID=A0A084XUZ6_9PROT|nr:MAG: hypothetical protein CAPSK01_004451 [Candidatus Accumulibacter vicinus]